jgi:hypothetical protein
VSSNALDSKVGYPAALVLDDVEHRVSRIVVTGSADFLESYAAQFLSERFVVPHPKVPGIPKCGPQEAPRAPLAVIISQMCIDHETMRRLRAATREVVFSEFPQIGKHESENTVLAEV